CRAPSVVPAVLFVFLDLDPPPESDVAGDLFRSRLWRGVVPGRITIGLSVHHDIVVARGAFPAAHGVGLGFAQVGVVDVLGREVDVALDHAHVVGAGLRDDRSVPHRFRHRPILDQPRCTVSRWRLTRKRPEATMTLMPPSAQPSGKLPNTRNPSVMAQSRPEY